jgi:hypothetical protein
MAIQKTMRMLAEYYNKELKLEFPAKVPCESSLNLNKDFVSNLQKLFGLDTFLETGTYLGQTARMAASLFDEVHTIELSKTLYENAKSNLSSFSNISCHQGDTSLLLAPILRDIERRGKKVLFWLDAHYSEGITARGNTNTPIINELQAILESNVPHFVVLIDDIRCFIPERSDTPPPLKEYPSLSQIVTLMGPCYDFVVYQDVAVILPKQDHITMSPILKACTTSRLIDEKSEPVDGFIPDELRIGHAHGIERELLVELPLHFAHSEAYGLGGHYWLWRGLIMQNNNNDSSAILDFSRARDLSCQHWRVKWYQAQSLIKLGKAKECKAVLSEVIIQKPDFAPARDLFRHAETMSAAEMSGVLSPAASGTASGESGSPSLFMDIWTKMQHEYGEIQKTLSIDRYKELMGELCHPTWVSFADTIKTMITGNPDTDFLHHPAILQTMLRIGFGPSQLYEETFLKYCLSDSTANLVSKFKETAFGNLPIECQEFTCSTNSLGHLYYFARIMERTGPNLRSVIEFGGGYGNLCRIFKTLLPDSTYVIIDLPELLAVQFLFLRKTLGDAEVVLHKSPPSGFKEKSIHLVPAFFMEEIEFTPELFVSTFAISEATSAAQDLVIKKEFFRAKYCYVTGQLNGWGEGHRWENHDSLIAAIRARYSAVDCHPFHIFTKDQLSYEVHARDLISSRTDSKVTDEVRTSPNSIAVFLSKDRALQLDAALRSFFMHCNDPDNIDVCVYYKATTSQFENQYLTLKDDYPSVRFIPEINIKSDFISLIAPYDYFLGTVDDNIFLRKFSISEIVSLMTLHQNALGFSLRLGTNTTFCYMADRPQKLPEFKAIEGGYISYDWRSAEGDFGYAIEISSTLYRVADLMPVFQSENIKSSHDLEAKIFDKTHLFASKRPMMLCPEISLLISTPLNITKTDWTVNRQANRQDFTLESLAETFDKGRRIHVENFSGLTPQSCHMEIELQFESVRDRMSDNSNIKQSVCGTDYKTAVSVIIPCYNHANFLPAAVESIIKQTCQDWEIIIVNDGSSDNTSETARELISRYSKKKISIIEKPNSGVEDSRNKAIETAAGEWILPLDADDMFAPTFLEKAFEAISRDKSINLVFSNLRNIGYEEGPGWIPSDYSPGKILEEDTFPYASLFRKEMWHQAGGYPQIPLGAEDWCFWISCSRYGIKPHRIAEPLFLYRTHPHGNNRYARMMRHWEVVKAMVHSFHPELYSVEQLCRGHETISRMDTSVLERVETIINRFPDHPMPYLWKGLHMESSGFPEEAVLCYERAGVLSKRPDWQVFWRISESFRSIADTANLTGNLRKSIESKKLSQLYSIKTKTSIQHCVPYSMTTES